MQIKNFAILALTALTLAACGGEEKPAPAAPASAPTAEAPQAEAPKAEAPAPQAEAPAATETAGVDGEKVYKKTCALCHASGVAGAPIPGNHDDWDARVAQGNDVLYKHALEGFTGEKGMMPPRGGGTSLKDDEVKAAVDFMVSKLN